MLEQEEVTMQRLETLVVKVQDLESTPPCVVRVQHLHAKRSDQSRRKIHHLYIVGSLGLLSILILAMVKSKK